jgi:uncharacterized protein YgbK (DUF1537 family)
MLLGCIADDLTGATDVAVNLHRAGLRVVQVNGVPAQALALPACDAVVVALKSRTIAPAEACAQALAALRWLRARGAPRIYFKICSTFDSTARGNIGPVADALADALIDSLADPRAAADASVCLPVVCTPAYPRNARTVYHGHLFVGPVLLSDSGMRHHPLTPMTDANLVRVLQAQTPHPVGLLPLAVIAHGAAAVQDALHAATQAGTRHLIADAIDDAHLDALARAIAGHALAVGGAGLAAALGAVLAQQAAPAPMHAAPPVPASPPPLPSLPMSGPIAILAGSCSTATLAQLNAGGRWPTVALDADALLRDAPREHARVLAALPAPANASVLVVRASLPADQLHAVQARHGTGAAAQAVEEAFRAIAPALAARGVRRFIVAGGETSGAVIAGLGVAALSIGAEIAPGVPWTTSTDGRFALALKSGNFGGPDFLQQAVDSAP